jgi:copper chaperone CopZ
MGAAALPAWSWVRWRIVCCIWRLSGAAGQVSEGWLPSSRVVEFSISGMTCAACSARLEKVLNRQPGMQANVNLAAERARVRLADAADEAAVIAAVAKAGFSAAPVDKPDAGARKSAPKLQDYRSAKSGASGSPWR